jgi:7-cyano-7-deazaguanine synthase
MNRERNAVVLLSGGLDSAVTLAIARAEGYLPHALTVDYGQRHREEIDAARRVAAALGSRRHIVMAVDLTEWGGSALTADLVVPTGRRPDQIGHDIPVTYVPARNTILLALGMAWAETLGTGDLFIGAHTLDFSGYPDCRPEFFAAFEGLARRATRSGVEETVTWHVHTPLIGLTKADIVRRGVALGVPFELTQSCYQPRAVPGGKTIACGLCDSCILRRRAFAAVGIADPIPYAVQEC